MINQVYLSTATSSGTRFCFYCNELITDKTLLIENKSTPIAIHIPCFKSFLSDLNKENGRF